MKFKNYINENYKKALNIDEPEIGGKYSDDAVQKRIEIIEAGIKDANKLPDDEHKEGIIADLNDKIDKWENVSKEIEAPKIIAPPEGEEEAGGEEEDADAEADEDEAAKDAEDKEKDREDKDIEKDEKAMDRDEEKEKEREKKEKEREKKREKGQKESTSFKRYMYLNSDIKNEI